MTTNANYGGRVADPNTSTYTKFFNQGTAPNLFATIPDLTGVGGSGTIVPASPYYKNLTIPGNLNVNGDLTVYGVFTNPSDIILKDNIVEISTEFSDNIMKLKPTQFTFKTDLTKKIHYGFIAQEFETQFPELVVNKPDNNNNHYHIHHKRDIKAINYLEVIPLLVSQIQKMQNEINELKLQIHGR